MSVVTPRWLLGHVEEIVAAAALVVVVAATTWGVVTRYVMAQAAAWTIEVSTIGFAWVVYFGSVACIKYRLHPAVDLPMDRLPRTLRLLVTGLNHVLLVSFFGFMVWFGARFAMDAWTRRSSVLQLPMTVLYGPIAVCFALMLVRYFQYALLARRVAP